ncbi:MAG: sigma-70 family RNA polymerase sigma factor [Armatimonadetes bacterium]|nr:sigma-70 family RNA polymerase sigma factor [Armatimonadota bacterium]MDW8028052.1 sigma-70 family RNA polymerase sigma factor [Armatimonadota bacterium]
MDEMELVRKAKSGDVAAFDDLVHRYWEKVYRLAESIVGQADAEDVAVETFVQAWKGIAQFREQSSFGSWLFRITVNQAKQWQRKVAMVQFEPIEDQDEPISLRDIEDIACERDWRRRVKAAVQNLPEQLRLPLVLRFWGDLSYPEIAKLLGIKESTARMRVVAALKILASVLGLTEKPNRRRKQ